MDWPSSQTVFALPRSAGGNQCFTNFAANLQTTRYRKVETWQQNAANDRSFGAKWITDLDLSYLLFDSLTLSIGGTNIFNVRPDNNGITQAAYKYNYGSPPFHPGGASGTPNWHTIFNAPAQVFEAIAAGDQASRGRGDVGIDLLRGPLRG